MWLAGIVALVALLAAAPRPDAAAAPAAYAGEVEAWRRQREARLRAPDGWLALVGLTRLRPGENRFGSAPDDPVRLPAPVPPRAGVLLVDGLSVTVALRSPEEATLNGQAVRGAAAPQQPALPLRTDANGATPDLIGFGQVTLQVIARGGGLAARVKDPNSEARRRFAGCHWYPVATQYRAVARLQPGSAGATITVPDASGGRQTLPTPGTLVFDLLGRTHRLDPVRDGPDDSDLLVVFRDGTSGRDTYGGGRFVRAHRQADGTFLLDFNRAYAPPCAFTPYATCPLPPPQNRLPMPVPAGERTGPGAASPRPQGER